MLQYGTIKSPCRRMDSGDFQEWPLSKAQIHAAKWALHNLTPVKLIHSDKEYWFHPFEVCEHFNWQPPADWFPVERNE